MPEGGPPRQIVVCAWDFNMEKFHLGPEGEGQTDLFYKHICEDVQLAPWCRVIAAPHPRVSLTTMAGCLGLGVMRHYTPDQMIHNGGNDARLELEATIAGMFLTKEQNDKLLSEKGIALGLCAEDFMPKNFSGAAITRNKQLWTEPPPLQPPESPTRRLDRPDSSHNRPEPEHPAPSAQPVNPWDRPDWFW